MMMMHPNEPMISGFPFVGSAIQVGMPNGANNVVSLPKMFTQSSCPGRGCTVIQVNSSGHKVGIQ